MNNTTAEIKIILQGINSRLGDTAEWVRDWKTVEVLESEQQQQEKEFFTMRIH